LELTFFISSAKCDIVTKEQSDLVLENSSSIVWRDCLAGYTNWRNLGGPVRLLFFYLYF